MPPAWHPTPTPSPTPPLPAGCIPPHTHTAPPCRWVHVDPLTNSVDDAAAVAAKQPRERQPLPHVVALAGGGAKDVTQRWVWVWGGRVVELGHAWVAVWLGLLPAWSLCRNWLPASSSMLCSL